MKVREMLHRLVKTVRRERHRHTEACRAEACEREADQKLHDLGARLHVLEWETYGPDAAKRKRKPS